MRCFKLKIVAVFLVLMMVFHISTVGFLGSQQVKAGFWDEHKDSILTVVKGMIMLWILNLMRENIGGNDGEDDIASVDINDRDEVIINNEFVTDLEFELLKLINKVRQEEGLDLLEIDMKLSRIARRKAIDMINYNYFDHSSINYGTPFEMLENGDIEYFLAGENLAEADSVEEAFQLLMNSAEHRANILNSRYDRIGIGVVEKSSDILEIVQIFVDSPEPTI